MLLLGVILDHSTNRWQIESSDRIMLDCQATQLLSGSRKTRMTREQSLNLLKQQKGIGYGYKAIRR